MCLLAKPLNRSEANGDFVMIQNLRLFKCKFLCCYAISTTRRSPLASFQIKGLATKNNFKMAYLMNETVISDINFVRVVVSYSIKH